MKRGDYRITVNCLASGQPRAYADSIYHYRVLFEWIPVFTNEPIEWKPTQWNQQVVEKHLKAIKYWVEKDRIKFADPILDFIKKVDEGTWEFQVREEFLG